MSETPNLFMELPDRSATVDFPSVDGCKEATVTLERTSDNKLYIKIETNDLDDYMISTEEITIDLTATEDLDD